MMATILAPSPTFIPLKFSPPFCRLTHHPSSLSKLARWSPLILAIVDMIFKPTPGRRVEEGVEVVEIAPAVSRLVHGRAVSSRRDFAVKCAYSLAEYW